MSIRPRIFTNKNLLQGDRTSLNSYSKLQNFIQSVLKEVDVEINGDRPWDLRVHNPQLYPRLIAQGSLGLGEAYVEGWWDCDRLDELFAKILRGRLQDRIGSNNLGSCSKITDS